MGRPRYAPYVAKKQHTRNYPPPRQYGPSIQVAATGSAYPVNESAACEASTTVVNATSLRSACWERLPLTIVKSLTEEGRIFNVVQLVQLSESSFNVLVGSSYNLCAHRQLLGSLRTEPFDQALFLQNLMATKRPPAAATVHECLGVPGAALTSCRPAPRDTLRALEQAKTEGKSVADILDGVVDRRAGCAISDSTGLTYRSHLNHI